MAEEQFGDSGGTANRPEPAPPERPRSSQPRPPSPQAVLLRPPAPPAFAPGVDPAWGGGSVQPEPIRRIELEPRWLAAAAAAAVAADLALRRPPWNNVASSLLIFVIATGLLASGRVRQRPQQALLVGSLVFGLFLSLRTDPRLIFFNLVASALLLTAATIPSARLLDLRPVHALRHALEIWVQPFVVLANLVPQLRVRRAGTTQSPRAQRVAAVARGLVVAGPILIIFGLLLASADAVFASFFNAPPISVSRMIGHGVLLTLGGLGMATAIRLTFVDPHEGEAVAPMSFGRIETLVVLAALDLLFLLFAVAQLVARSDTGGAVIEAGGLSYKQYARQGFFQLLWVAGLTLVILLAVRTWTQRWSKGDRVFLGLSLVAVALTLLIVAVAFGRLQLYIGDNGLTPLRFYSSVFSLWIGAAFLLVVVRMAGWHHDRAWMLSAIVGTGLLTLLSLNIANPEAIIANDNLDRGDSPILWHMEKLTGDGQRVLAVGLDRLPVELQVDVQRKLCEGHETNRGSEGRGEKWLDWNWGNSRGQEALTSLCS